jgi:hypothetical protein
MNSPILRSVLLASFALAAASARGGAPDLSVGKPFPRIPLPSIAPSEGDVLQTIDAFSGKMTLVHIFAGW